MLGRAASLAFLLVVMGAAVWGVSAWWRDGARTPTTADVDDTTRAVAALGLGEDDVLLVVPPWSFQPLVGLGRLGAPRVAQRALPADGPWDVLHRHRHRRVALWREPSAEPWLAGRDHDVLHTPAAAFGAVTLAVVADTPATFDGLRAFGAAGVSVDGAPCDIVGRGRRCPRGARATREWALVTENGADVITLVPPQGGAIAVGFDDVTLQTSLVIAAGHTRRALERARVARTKDPSADGAVVVRAFFAPVDGPRVALFERAVAPQFRVEPQRADAVTRLVHDRPSWATEGFVADVVDTSRVSGQRGTLTLTVSAAIDGMEVGVDVFVPGVVTP